MAKLTTKQLDYINKLARNFPVDIYEELWGVRCVEWETWQASIFITHAQDEAKIRRHGRGKRRVFVDCDLCKGTALSSMPTLDDPGARFLSNNFTPIKCAACSGLGKVWVWESGNLQSNLTNMPNSNYTVGSRKVT